MYRAFNSFPRSPESYVEPPSPTSQPCRWRAHFALTRSTNTTAFPSDEPRASSSLNFAPLARHCASLFGGGNSPISLSTRWWLLTPFCAARIGWKSRGVFKGYCWMWGCAGMRHATHVTVQHGSSEKYIRSRLGFTDQLNPFGLITVQFGGVWSPCERCVRKQMEKFSWFAQVFRFVVLEANQDLWSLQN